MKHELGGKRWNDLEDAIVLAAAKIEDDLVKQLMADGYPYGTEPESERDLYYKLSAQYQANSPLFWDDPTAAKKLQQLSAKFGPPPAPYAPPIETMPPAPVPPASLLNMGAPGGP